MPKTIINYYKKRPSSQLINGDEILLGKETFESINEIILPVNYKNTPFYITKSFDSSPCIRWRVDIVVGDIQQKGTYNIYLSEKNITTDIYLNNTSIKAKKPFWAIVKKGMIVIVEFGHIYQISNQQGYLKNTDSYPCFHQNGEMHKRRAAIVISSDKNGVKVVPVTSQKPTSYPQNKSIFMLSKESTQLITEFNNNKDSYVLCEMIQTISPTRILPPEAINRKSNKYFRDEGYTRRINKKDEWQLKNALLSCIGEHQLLQDNYKLKDITSNLTSENSNLKNKIQTLEENMFSMNRRFQILRQLYMGMNTNFSSDDLDNEINEYLDFGID
ncbi:type II toxin-antitoxin system PemK/MazF family toxin [Salmonella enterica]|nr:type II toxin-antitoxin system PemK/MazF family toxin [Salmonella enterica]